MQRVWCAAGCGEDGLEQRDQPIEVDRPFCLFERGDNAFERADSLCCAPRKLAAFGSEDAFKRVKDGCLFLGGEAG